MQASASRMVCPCDVVISTYRSSAAPPSRFELAIVTVHTVEEPALVDWDVAPDE